MQSLDYVEKTLKKLLNDYDYAKEWGRKARKRGKEIFSIKHQNRIFTEAFKDAIEEGKCL